MVQLCVDQHQTGRPDNAVRSSIQSTNQSSLHLLLGKSEPGVRKGSVPSVTNLTNNLTADLRKSLPDLLSDVDKHSDPYLPQPKQQQSTGFESKLTDTASIRATRNKSVKSRPTQFSSALKHSLSSDSILDVPTQAPPAPPPSLSGFGTAPTSSFVQQSPSPTIISTSTLQRSMQPPTPPIRNQRNRFMVDGSIGSVTSVTNIAADVTTQGDSAVPPPLPPKRGTNFARRIEHASIVNNHSRSATLRAPVHFSHHHHHHQFNRHNHLNQQQHHHLDALNHLSNSLAHVSLSADSLPLSGRDTNQVSDASSASSSSARKHHSDNGQLIAAGQLRANLGGSTDFAFDSHSTLNLTKQNDSSIVPFTNVTLRSKPTSGTTGSIYRRRNNSYDGSDSPSPPPPSAGVRLRSAHAAASVRHRESSSGSSLGSAFHDGSTGTENRPRSQYDNLSLSDYDCNDSVQIKSGCNSSMGDFKLNASQQTTGSRSSAENASLRSSIDSNEIQILNAKNSIHDPDQMSYPAVRINLQPPDDPPPLPPKRKNIATYMQMLGSYGRPSEATLHANYRHSMHVYRDLSRTQSTYQQVEQSFRQQRALDLQLSAAANAAGLRRARHTRCSQDSAMSAQSFCSDSSQINSMQWHLPTSIAQALQQSAGSSTYLSTVSNGGNHPSSSNSQSNMSSNGSLATYPVSLCTSECSLNSSRTSGSSVSAGICVNSLASDLAVSLANQLASGLVNQLTNPQFPTPAPTTASSTNRTINRSINLLQPMNSSHHQIDHCNNNLIQSNPPIQIACAVNRELPPMLPPKRAKAQPPPVPVQMLARKPEAYQLKSGATIDDVIPEVSANSFKMKSEVENSENIQKHLSNSSLDRAER